MKNLFILTLLSLTIVACSQKEEPKADYIPPEQSTQQTATSTNTVLSGDIKSSTDTPNGITPPVTLTEDNQTINGQATLVSTDTVATTTGDVSNAIANSTETVTAPAGENENNVKTQTEPAAQTTANATQDVNTSSVTVTVDKSAQENVNVSSDTNNATGTTAANTTPAPAKIQTSNTAVQSSTESEKAVSTATVAISTASAKISSSADNTKTENTNVNVSSNSASAPVNTEKKPANAAGKISCEKLSENLSSCTPFKCSITSNFLGQNIDDIYEVKGMRNNKCRYVTGITIVNKDGIESKASTMICNFDEAQRAESAEFLKDINNLKSNISMGLKDKPASTNTSPFVKYDANDVCVKPCTKDQTEIKRIVLENGHFIEKKSRCPSED